MVEMFGWEGWFTLAVLTVMFSVLLVNWAPADFVMLGTLAVVMVAQIVSTTEGLEGFSSSAVLTVAVLYVVAAGINASGALEYFFNKVLGHPSSLAIAQLRMMIPVAVVSAFLNNTPVVAIVIPIIQNYAQRIRQPVSQLFIPLSFASILGGTCTLIGTSTNLVVAGKYDQTFNKTMGLFDLGTVGVPVLFSGLSYIILFSPLLLPGFVELRRRSRKALGLDPDSIDDGTGPNGTDGIGSDFTVGCVVTEWSSVKGKAVDDAGLRGLEGLYLTSIQRCGRIFNAVGPEFVVQVGDILYFTGIFDSFDAFCIQYGFLILTDANEDEHSVCDMLDNRHDNVGGNGGGDASSYHGRQAGSSGSNALGKPPFANKIRCNTFEERIVKVVIRSGSCLEGRTAKEANFRTTFDAAILSIFRAGQAGPSTSGTSLGRVVLEVGDVLLIVTGNKFNWAAETTQRDLKPYVSDAIAVQLAEDEQWAHGKVDQGINNSINNSVKGVQPAAGATSTIPSQADIQREFFLQMRVVAQPKLLGARTLVGQTVEDAGLRGLPGLFLVAVERADGTVEHVIGPDCLLLADDVLWFAGERDSLATLRRIPGLESPEDTQAQKLPVKSVNRRLVECVLSMRSPMVGKTVREAKFRTLYEAAIIAVHRQGQRVLSKIGDIELRAGDVLILDTGPLFVKKYRDDKNFLLVTEIDDSTPPRFSKFYIALTATLVMVVSFVIWNKYISLFEPAVFAAGTMIAFDCISTDRARAAVSWDVIVTIACAFGLSNALQNTGVADTVGHGLVKLAEVTGTGYPGVLAAVYLAGFLISIVIANNATALLLFPIATTAAVNACPADSSPDLCLQQMVYVLMLSASSSFSSPYGYQTNTMVLGCGNYVFKDFLRVGFPMQFWQMVFSLLAVWYLEYWYVSWLVTFVFFIFVVITRIFWDKSQSRKKSAFKDALVTYSETGDKHSKQSDFAASTEDLAKVYVANSSKICGTGSGSSNGSALSERTQKVKNVGANSGLVEHLALTVNDSSLPL